MTRTGGLAVLCVALALECTGCGGQLDDSATAAAPATAPATLPAIAPHRPPPEIVAAHGLEDLVDLKHEVNLLKQEVASLRQQMSSARSMIQEDGRGPGSESLSAETAFRKQPTDPSWSTDAGARVRSALAQSEDGLGAQVASIECRASTCRVEILPEGDDAIEQNLSAIFNQLAPTFSDVSATVLDVGSGERRTVLHFSR